MRFNTALKDVMEDSNSIDTALPENVSGFVAPALKLGLNYCSNEFYHADRKFKSSSVLKSIDKDLQQYFQDYEMGQRAANISGAALDEGSLAHTLILEPQLMNSEYIFYPGFDKRGNVFKDFKEQKQASGDMRPIFSAAQKAKVEAWVQSYRNHPTASSYIDGGIPEVSICCYYVYSTGALIFTEEEAAVVPENDRVGLKVRFDSVNTDKGFITDVKTTKDAAGASTFKAAALGDFLMYDLSSALYLWVAEEFYKKQLEFYFVVLSKADIACNVYRLSAATRALGLKKVRQALLKYQNARLTNVWTDNAAIAAAVSDKVEEI